jgi:hypothetical protein
MTPQRRSEEERVESAIPLVKELGFPVAACVVLLYAIKLLFSAYQEQVKARDAEQAAEIERLQKLLAERK